MSLSVSMTVDGVNRLKNSLRGLAAANRTRLDPVVHKWAQETRAELKSTAYPSYLPHFRHKRTGKLAVSWSARRTGTARFVIGNSQTYTQYVVGRDTQRSHPSFARWWIMEDVIEKRLPELRSLLADELFRVWHG